MDFGGWIGHMLRSALSGDIPVATGPPNRSQRRYRWHRYTPQGPTHLQKRARNRARNKRAAASRRANR